MNAQDELHLVRVLVTVTVIFNGLFYLVGMYAVGKVLRLCHEIRAEQERVERLDLRRRGIKP